MIRLAISLTVRALGSRGLAWAWAWEFATTVRYDRHCLVASVLPVREEEEERIVDKKEKLCEGCRTAIHGRVLKIDDNQQSRSSDKS